jgi:hypothetical protein
MMPGKPPAAFVPVKSDNPLRYVAWAYITALDFATRSIGGREKHDLTVYLVGGHAIKLSDGDAQVFHEQFLAHQADVAPAQGERERTL